MAAPGRRAPVATGEPWELFRGGLRREVPGWGGFSAPGLRTCLAGRLGRLPQSQSAGNFLLSVPSSLPSPRSPACVGQSSSRPWGSAWSGRVVLPSRVIGQSESLVWV